MLGKFRRQPMPPTPIGPRKRERAERYNNVDPVPMGLIFNDQYEVVSKLGSGGFGDVYKAICKKTRLEVAIKVEEKDNGVRVFKNYFSISFL